MPLALYFGSCVATVFSVFYTLVIPLSTGSLAQFNPPSQQSALLHHFCRALTLILSAPRCTVAVYKVVHQRLKLFMQGARYSAHEAPGGGPCACKQTNKNIRVGGF